MALPEKTFPEIEAGRLEPLYERIRAILAEARLNVTRTVNAEMVRAYWLVGREIVEEEQAGHARAGYGEALIEQISARLQGAFGKGFTTTNLRYMRLFYSAYPQLLDAEIHHALRDESPHMGYLNPNLSWTHYRLLNKGGVSPCPLVL